MDQSNATTPHKTKMLGWIVRCLSLSMSQHNDPRLDYSTISQFQTTLFDVTGNDGSPAADEDSCRPLCDGVAHHPYLSLLHLCTVCLRCVVPCFTSHPTLSRLCMIYRIGISLCYTNRECADPWDRVLRRSHPRS
jgi:hypothetical protein